MEALSIEKKQYHIDTLATKKIDVRLPVHPIATPIYHSATYHLENAEHGQLLCDQKDLKDGQSPWLYSRWGNPTNDVAERLISSLEGAAGSIVTASGCGAISTFLLATLKAGDHAVVTKNVYGGTFELFAHILPGYNISVTWVDQTNIDEYDKAIQPNTKLLYGEVIANPSMQTLDIKEFAAIAKKHNIQSALDATFASSYNSQPIQQYGIDVVLHSATKYLGGHSDLLAGIIATRTQEQFLKVANYHRLLGSTASPNSGFLLIRGIKTLHLRVERHNSNALAIAKYLESNPKIEKVWYLGLESHPQHELAKKQFKGFGGMIAFEVKGGIDAGKTVIENLQLINLAVSLGGVESLINQPSTMTHSMVPREKRYAAGITDGMIRFSVGCENVQDLIGDLEHALSFVK